MRADQNKTGFTLLEVLIAFAIAALALTLLYRGAGSGTIATQVAAQYQEALSRARSHLATLGHSVPLRAGERFGDDGGGFRWRLRITPVAVGRLPAGATAPVVPTLFSVEVGIAWSSSVQPREVVLRSMRLGTSAPP